jgi:hypothetical protein
MRARKHARRAPNGNGSFAQKVSDFKSLNAIPESARQCLQRRFPDERPLPRGHDLDMF